MKLVCSKQLLSPSFSLWATSPNQPIRHLHFLRLRCKQNTYQSSIPAKNIWQHLILYSSLFSSKRVSPPLTHILRGFGTIPIGKFGRNDFDTAQPIVRMGVGDSIEMTRTYTANTIQQYAEVSQDNNPIHTNPELASESRFGRCIAHGFHTASMFSTIIGRTFPGAIYVSQNIKFVRPVFVDDTVTAKCEITDLQPSSQSLSSSLDQAPSPHRVTIQTTCSNQDEKLVISGEAVILLDLIETSAPKISTAVDEHEEQAKRGVLTNKETPIN